MKISPSRSHTQRGGEERRGCSVPIEVRCGVNTPRQQAGSCCLPCCPSCLPFSPSFSSLQTWWITLETQHSPNPLRHSHTAWSSSRDRERLSTSCPRRSTVHMSVWRQSWQFSVFPPSPPLLPPTLPLLPPSLPASPLSFHPSFFYSLRWDSLIVAIALVFSEWGMALRPNTMLYLSVFTSIPPYLSFTPLSLALSKFDLYTYTYLLSFLLGRFSSSSSSVSYPLKGYCLSLLFPGGAEVLWRSPGAGSSIITGQIHLTPFFMIRMSY